MTLASDLLWHWGSREATATVGYDVVLRQARLQAAVQALHFAQVRALGLCRQHGTQVEQKNPGQSSHGRLALSIAMHAKCMYLHLALLCSPNSFYFGLNLPAYALRQGFDGAKRCRACSFEGRFWW